MLTRNPGAPALQEIVRLDSQSLSHVPQGEKSDILNAALHRADVSTIHTDFHCKRFLGQTSAQALAPKIQTENLTDIHPTGEH